MTKITVDKALIEQAVGALETPDGLDEYNRSISDVSIDALRAALAEPVVEPVAKHCMPHGWVINWPHPNGGTRPVYHPRSIQPKFGDMKPTMYPVYTSPPPAEPAVEPSTDDSSVLSACQKLAQAFKTSPPPPAEPAVEPFGYFRAEPFGWTDCAPTDEGAKALYEVPPPAEPARTSQDVCTVPLLSDDEVAQCIKDASKGSAINRDGSTSQRIVRSAEQLVRRKAGL